MLTGAGSNVIGGSVEADNWGNMVQEEWYPDESDYRDADEYDDALYPDDEDLPDYSDDTGDTRDDGDAGDDGEPVYYFGEDVSHPLDATIDDLVPADPEAYRVSEDADNFDYNSAAGVDIWLDHNTLEFLFAVRYNSAAFSGSFLQEEYRRETHRDMSDLIHTLVQQKLEAMREMPWLYQNSGKNRDREMIRELDDEDRDNILAIADELGIHAEEIDVISVVEEVIASLEIMLARLIRIRPGMSIGDKKAAIRFLDSQLWDEDMQLLWRGVSANMLATMYSYQNLPETLPIIMRLTDYANAEFRTGSLQGQTVETAYIEALLSDETVERVMDTLRDADPDDDPNLLIDEAIMGAPDDDYYGWG